MKSLPFFLVLAVTLASAPAQAATRNWIQPPGLEQSQLCLDQNSIAKTREGLTQFQLLALCNLSQPANLPGEEWVMSYAVQCDQDMSGDHFLLATRATIPDKQGNYRWNAPDSQKSQSACGLFAKYVCHK